jgi:hypothetical protein
VEKRTSTYVILALLVWAVSGTLVAGYYSVQYSTYHDEYANLLNALKGISNSTDSILVKINFLLSYGNRTNMWLNDTAFPTGTTAFTALRIVASDVNYTDFGGTLGVYVNRINGLKENLALYRAWFFWYKTANASSWTLADRSCSEFILHRGDTVAFAYQNYEQYPPSPPT